MKMFTSRSPQNGAHFSPAPISMLGMLLSSPRFSEAVEFGQRQNFPLSCGASPPHGVSELPAVCTGVLENSLVPGAQRLSKWPFSKTALSLRRPKACLAP
ncbi:unnamed protein product [Arctogadus glacialis]